MAKALFLVQSHKLISQQPMEELLPFLMHMHTGLPVASHKEGLVLFANRSSLFIVEYLQSIHAKKNKSL